VATISLTNGDHDDDDDRTIREEDDEVSVGLTLSLSLTSPIAGNEKAKWKMEAHK